MKDIKNIHKYIKHLKFLNVLKQNVFNIYSDCLPYNWGNMIFDFSIFSSFNARLC